MTSAARARGLPRLDRLRPVLRVLLLLPGGGRAAARRALLPLRPRAAAARGGAARARSASPQRGCAGCSWPRGSSLAGLGGCWAPSARGGLRGPRALGPAHALGGRRRHPRARARTSGRRSPALGRPRGRPRGASSPWRGRSATCAGCLPARSSRAPCSRGGPPRRAARFGGALALGRPPLALHCAARLGALPDTTRLLRRRLAPAGRCPPPRAPARGRRPRSALAVRGVAGLGLRGALVPARAAACSPSRSWPSPRS